MPFKGTDKNAYKRASAGKTRTERSRLYKKYKKENEGGGIFSFLFGKSKTGDTRIKPVKVNIDGSRPHVQKQNLVKKMKTQNKSTKVSRRNDYYKQTLLDDLRDYRSSKVVSCISDGLAQFVIKCGGQEWDNSTKNEVRSAIALVASEVINKAFEEPLKIVKNIELFIKVGKTIYKVVAWIDEKAKQLRIIDSEFSEVSNGDAEYTAFSEKYSIPVVD
ncbi:MAG: hypothetical protein PHX51_06805 [Clostridia bacterium]|nr:hypothetical protein [Clostridia bacterium]